MTKQTSPNWSREKLLRLKKRITKGKWKIIDSFGTTIAKGFHNKETARIHRQQYKLGRQDILEVVEE